MDEQKTNPYCGGNFVFVPGREIRSWSWLYLFRLAETARILHLPAVLIAFKAHIESVESS